MEMHQIRYFLTVAEELNFTRAAERCDVAQPSISRAIKMFEIELDGPLFHRERMSGAFTPTIAYVGEHLSAEETAGALAAYKAGGVASNLIRRLVAAGAVSSAGLSASFFVFAVLEIPWADPAVARSQSRSQRIPLQDPKAAIQTRAYHPNRNFCLPPGPAVLP